MEDNPTEKPTERLLSIDALRGFDMFWIIGGDRLGRALGKWSGTPAGNVVREQLEHVSWEGFRFYDLIFPLFLFLVGTVLPFSLGKIPPEDHKAAYRRIARRTIFLFALGLLSNGIFQFDWAELRITGVLQRIAICYGIGAVIFLNSSTRGVIITLVMILLGYWAVMTYIPAPGETAGDLSKEKSLAGWVDRHYLPGKIKQAYYGFGDNEGLLSTIPAVGTVLLGVLAGSWLRTSRRPWTKVAGLAAAGAVCLGAGIAWGHSFPIIKNLWTSSFVLVAGGLSILLLALFYAVIDVLGFRRWAFFFVVIGVNAITIYVARSFIEFNHIADFFLGGTYRLAGRFGPPDLRLVIAALGVLVVEWLFLLFLYRNKIYLRV